MQEQKIVFIGLGFLGSWFNEMACKAIFTQDIEANVVYIDDDAFELRNAGNQNINLAFAVQETPKVMAASRVAMGYKIKATTHQTRLNMDNMFDLLEGATLIIDSVDNVPTRQLLNMAGTALKVPVMHLGISKKGSGRIDWTAPGFSTFPYTVEAMAGRKMADDDGGGEPPCEMFAHLPNGLMLVGAATKALCLYYGKDPWDQSQHLIRQACIAAGLEGDLLNEMVTTTVEEIGPRMEMEGLITCWDTWPEGCRIRTDLTTLVDDFYPVLEGSE